MKKSDKRVWQDGIVTYYTMNKRVRTVLRCHSTQWQLTEHVLSSQLTLRDARGHLLDESFCETLPKAQTTSIKEEGIRPATIPTGVLFQLNDTYTIEVERIKFVNEKVRETERVGTESDR
jgi:hypothetical protein